MLNCKPQHLRRQRQAGFSVVELMVGLVIGLFIVGGALKLFVDYLGRNRTIALEARVNQDLRAAADLIARDLRRAGYWQNAATSVWNSTASAFNTNNYRAISVGTANSNAQITYAYAKDNNDAVDGTVEARGFQIGPDGSLQMRQGGNWQAVTDPNTLTITMAITPSVVTVDLWNGCSCLNDLSCTQASFQTGGANHANRPRADISDYIVTLTGTSVTDGNVRRSIVERIRVRNDEPAGACPT